MTQKTIGRINRYKVTRNWMGVFVEAVNSGARKYIGRNDDDDAVQVAQEMCDEWNEAADRYTQTKEEK